MQKNKLPSIQDTGALKGKYVLLRTELNVPIDENGQVQNQFRIMRALPTIQYLQQQGARVIMIGHLQTKEGPVTFQPVYDILKTHIDLTWCPHTVGEVVTMEREKLQDGEVLFLENVRLDPREKKNDPDYVKALADLAEVYINDAFAVSHRPHASIVGVPHYLPSYFGINFIREFEELSKVLQPKNPSVFILGGAKFDTKMPLIEKFLDVYDHIVIGGALANDFFKAKGYEVGTSLVSDSTLAGSSLLKNPKIILPVDVTVKDENSIRVTTPDAVKSSENILDVGPDTTLLLSEHIRKAQTILWNGPMGDYEHGFEAQTLDVAKHIANSDSYSLVGGGDTVAAIETLCLQENFGFLSTAGGAMLQFLELGTLPAIEAVTHKKTKDK